MPHLKILMLKVVDLAEDMVMKMMMKMVCPEDKDKESNAPNSKGRVANMSMIV